MTKWCRSTGAAMVVALLVQGAAMAQATKPAQPAPKAAAKTPDARELNLRAYVELMRSDLRKQKVALIAEVMQFTEDEDRKFWPVYREYEAELGRINDERLQNIQMDGRIPPPGRFIDLRETPGAHAAKISIAAFAPRLPPPVIMPA